MAGYDAVLSEDDRKFVVQRAAKGWEPQHIAYEFRNEHGKPITEETVAEFLASDEAKREIQLREEVLAKKSDVTKEELIETLVRLRDDLEEWREMLMSEGYGQTNNEAIKNLLKTVEKIGELTGELEDKQGSTANVITIDQSKTYIQNNISKVIQHLPKSEKKDVAEMLAEDPDVEDFVIVRKDED